MVHAIWILSIWMHVAGEFAWWWKKVQNDRVVCFNCASQLLQVIVDHIRSVGSFHPPSLTTPPTQLYGPTDTDALLDPFIHIPSLIRQSMLTLTHSATHTR